jgi:hypothetical protein
MQPATILATHLLPVEGHLLHIPLGTHSGELSSHVGQISG